MTDVLDEGTCRRAWEVTQGFFFRLLFSSFAWGRQLSLPAVVRCARC